MGNELAFAIVFGAVSHATGLWLLGREIRLGLLRCDLPVSERKVAAAQEETAPPKYRRPPGLEPGSNAEVEWLAAVEIDEAGPNSPQFSDREREEAAATLRRYGR